MNNVVRPTMNKLSTMLFQVVTVEQCCNNMLTVLFIVGRTTLFTTVNINLQQVVDFLNFYTCSTNLLNAFKSLYTVLHILQVIQIIEDLVYSRLENLQHCMSKHCILGSGHYLWEGGWEMGGGANEVLPL